MKKLHLSILMLISATAFGFGQTAIDFSFGYERSGDYDMIYSPNVYVGNGASARLGFSFGTAFVRHTIGLSFGYGSEQPNGSDVPPDFTYLQNGIPTPLDAMTSYFHSNGLGFVLSYSLQFRLSREDAPFRPFLGPELSVHGSMIGMDTYCLDYSLGLSLSCEYRLPANGTLRFDLAVPLVSLVNRPAYSLFDNQIMINWESNLIKEFVHFDKVASPFLGDFFSADLSLRYEYPLSQRWGVGIEYRGYFAYCAFPAVMLRLDHAVQALIELSF